jgi:hypothetical protein
MTKLIGAFLAGTVIVLGASSTACSVTVTANCGGGLVDCGDKCANLNDDPNNCGGCGISCGGDECIGGACTTIICVSDGSSCLVDGDCCSLFCASDGACGCIPNGDSSTFCNADSDCCSLNCDFASGYCVN